MKLSKKRHAVIVEFRLEGMRMDWAVYWGLYWKRLDQVRDYLKWGRSHPEAWHYFKTQECNILQKEHKQILETISK